MSWDRGVELAKVIIDVVVLVVGVAYWAGQIKSKREMPPVAPVREPHDPKSNGSPTSGEMLRRLMKLEAESVTKEELKLRAEANTREHEELWGVIRDLRAVDAATGRRVDGLFREGV